MSSGYGDGDGPDTSLVAARDIRERVAVILSFFVLIVAMGVVALVNEFNREPPFSAGESGRKRVLESTAPVKDSLKLARQFLGDQDYGAASAVLTDFLHDEENRSSLFRKDSETVEARRLLAICHDAEGDVEEAIKALLLAEKADPRSVGVLNNLGVLLFQKNDFANARTVFRRAQLLSPNTPEYFGGAASCAFSAGDYKAAIEDLSHLVRLSSSDPVARVNRAIALLKVGRYQEAVQDLEHVSVQRVANSETDKLVAFAQLKSGKYSAALKTLHENLSESGDPTFSALTLVALNGIGKASSAQKMIVDSLLHDPAGVPDLSVENMGQIESELLALVDSFVYEGACKPSLVLEEVPREADLSGDSASDLVRLGKKFLNAGDLNSAISCFSVVVNAFQGMQEAHRLRGLARMDLEEYVGAIEDFDLLIELAPDDAEFRTLAAICHVRVGEFGNAKLCLDHAIRIDHKNPTLYMNRATASFLAGDDFESVLRDCVRAERLGIESAELQDLRARALRKLGRFNEAISFHDKAVEKGKEDFRWLLSRAETYRDSGDLKLAIEDLRKYVHANATDPVGHANLVRCLLKLGKYEEGLEAAEVARAERAENASLSAFEGELLYKVERYKESAEQFRKSKAVLSDEQRRVWLASLVLSEQYEAANTLVQRLLEQQGDDYHLVKTAARVAAEVDDYSSAARCYDKLVEMQELLRKSTDELTNDEVKVLMLAAQAHFEVKNWAGTTEYLSKVVNASPELEDAWYLTGTCQHEQRNYVPAIKSFSKVLAENPLNGHCRLGRLNSLIALKDYERAKKDFVQVPKNLQQEPIYLAAEKILSAK